MTEPIPPKLSIVVLNYNSGDLLVNCLDSIFADDMPFPIQVIVPDNGTTDDSLARAQAKWNDRIQVIHTGANKGFAWGNNFGIRASHGEYVCLLNPDTIVHKGMFRELIAFMDSHPRAGFCGPKVLNTDGSFQLSAKRSIPSPFDAISRALHLSLLFPKSQRFARYNLTYLDPDATQIVDASTGCCMLARRTMLDEIGLVDENFFIYCEDVDWFLRAKKAAWETWYIGSVVLDHHHAYSERFRRSKAVVDFHRSMIYFHRKHHAQRYPFVVNALIYSAVYARMGMMIGWKSIKGWR